jgi:hypothetical protein
MCTPTQLDRDLFRILLYRKDASELLVEARPNGLRLPTVAIPSHTRIAEQITAAIKTSWDLDTSCLFPLSYSESSTSQLRYQVLEIWPPESEPPAGMRWLPTDSVLTAVSEDDADFGAVQDSVRKIAQYRRGELTGPFARPGWLETVTEWVKSQAASAHLSLTGGIRQLNASPTFSLLRYETDGPALWFKAVGEPNLHEYSITAKLATFFPTLVPHIVGSRPEWNAWLTTEVAGKHLDENADAAVWAAVARTLADLQIASYGKTLHFIHAGCHDTRISVLAEMIDPFLEVAALLMEKQTKKSPSRLSASELLVLSSQMHQIFSNLAQSDFPNALGHLDLNPGNILVSDSQCVFLDWAEACVGHPFIAFQYLREHLRKLRPTNVSETMLANVYSQRWEWFVDTQTIAGAMAASPLLAVFTCAVAGGAWRDESRRSRPEIAALLRSLTRRMKREADALSEGKLLWSL